jgi:hypothetical protein
MDMGKLKTAWSDPLQIRAGRTVGWDGRQRGPQGDRGMP